jgi:hypothetical protein
LDQEREEMLFNQQRERGTNFNFGAYHTLEEVGISKWKIRETSRSFL